jgi:oligopeptidase B
MRTLLLSALLLAAPLVRAQTPPPMAPPTAAQKPVTLSNHGVDRVDPYYWLNERENPEVIAYLNAENAYTDAQTAHLEALRQSLYDEMVARIPQDDASAPYPDRGWLYYTRYEEGREYPIFARKRSDAAPEQILLDVNELAEGYDYYQIGGMDVSPDGSRLAFAADTVGRRIYTLFVKDLTTGEMLGSPIDQMGGYGVWADNQTLFYPVPDPQTLRRYQIRRHTVGQTDPDAVVFEEPDDEFSVGVGRSKSGEFILVQSSQTLSDEVHYLRTDDPTGPFQVVAPRQRGLEYSVDHAGEHFYIRTNEGGAENFKLVRARPGATAVEQWETVLPAQDQALLEGFELFEDYLVTQELGGAVRRLRVRPHDAPAQEHFVAFDEPAYTVGLSINREYDTPTLRYTYSSMTTPERTVDYRMDTRERTVVKQTEVLGEFDSADYATERTWATASDGTQIPISIVRHVDTPADGTAPLLLYGYGSYGASMNASFSSTRLSLLDRGFVYAIAHIRGGQEMGRRWYEDGKLMQKTNTFTDFISAGEHLIATGHADPERLYAMGGSAGGLLMGAVVNMRPDLFDGVVAAVPFVDVVTTMLDDTIPLTTFEYDEWGNPNEPDAFRYMLSYSPYDNVRAQDYPHLLVTTGLHDSQVQYWEPAKWVARLREVKTDDNRLLLKTDMEAGHSGTTGRFRRFKDTAFDYAFLLDLAGVAE